MLITEAIPYFLGRGKFGREKGGGGGQGRACLHPGTSKGISPEKKIDGGSPFKVTGDQKYFYGRTELVHLYLQEAATIFTRQFL